MRPLRTSLAQLVELVGRDVDEGGDVSVVGVVQGQRLLGPGVGPG